MFQRWCGTASMACDRRASRSEQSPAKNEQHGNGYRQHYSSCRVSEVQNLPVRDHVLKQSDDSYKGSEERRRCSRILRRERGCQPLTIAWVVHPTVKLKLGH